MIFKLFPPPPPQEPIQCFEVPLPPQFPHPESIPHSISHITYVPSTAPSPNINSSHNKGKGKEIVFGMSPLSNMEKMFGPIWKPRMKNRNTPCPYVTPINSPIASPTNSVGSDLDMLLKKSSLGLSPLTIHKLGSASSPLISPNSARNITVRRKHNRGTRHFRGRSVVSSRNLDHSLIDIPIIELSDNGSLGARLASDG